MKAALKMYIVQFSNEVFATDPEGNTSLHGFFFFSFQSLSEERQNLGVLSGL